MTGLDAGQQGGHTRKKELGWRAAGRRRTSSWYALQELEKNFQVS